MLDVIDETNGNRWNVSEQADLPSLKSQFTHRTDRSEIKDNRPGNSFVIMSSEEKVSAAMVKKRKHETALAQDTANASLKKKASQHRGQPITLPAFVAGVFRFARHL